MGTLALGVVLGAIVVVGALTFTGGMSYDAACNQQLDGGNWSGEKVEAAADSGEVSIECTRSNETKTITASMLEVSES